MSKLVVVNREGQERVLEGDSSRSVMQIIRDNGLDEPVALCNGTSHHAVPEKPRVI